MYIPLSVTRCWKRLFQNFSKKLPKRSPAVLWLKSDVFKIAQKVNKYLGNFCNIICCQELSKIAQSGHTELPPYLHWISQWRRRKMWADQNLSESSFYIDWPSTFNYGHTLGRTTWVWIRDRGRGDVGKAKTSKEVDCLLAGRPAFVDTSSYVASWHKTCFGAVCGASVLICTQIQSHCSYSGQPTN